MLKIERSYLSPQFTTTFGEGQLFSTFLFYLEEQQKSPNIPVGIGGDLWVCVHLMLDTSKQGVGIGHHDHVVLFTIHTMFVNPFSLCNLLKIIDRVSQKNKTLEVHTTD